MVLEPVWGWGNILTSEVFYANIYEEKEKSDNTLIVKTLKIYVKLKNTFSSTSFYCETTSTYIF